MEIIKRVYVYEKTKEEVIKWARERGIRSPNRKENFPYYLEQYINWLKYNAK